MMKQSLYRWKRMLTCLVLAACMLMAGGCQKRAEADEPAMQLDMAQMVETAKVGAASLPETAAIDYYALLGAPRHYQTELVSASGKRKVHVDAELALPDCELPVVRVKKRKFTTEEAMRFAEVLMGSDAHYVDTLLQNGVPTAGVLQREIDALTDGIAHWDSYGNIKYDLVYCSKAEAERALAEKKAQLVNAPKAFPAVKPDFTWKYGQVWRGESTKPEKSGIGMIQLMAMPDAQTVSSLYVVSDEESAAGSEMRYDRDRMQTVGGFNQENSDVSAFVTIGEQAAYELAQRTVDALQVGDFTYVHRQGVLGDYGDWGCYGFLFGRDAAGAVESFTNAQFAFDGSGASWPYERISVLVDDAGILSVRYDSPSETLDTVTPNAALLPFGEIQSVFEKMVLLVNNRTETRDAPDDPLTMEYHITGIRLGTMSIAEDDSAETGLLIPVWDFMGYLTYHTNLEGDRTVYTNERQAFLTVNAIDGSIIDREKGY